MSAAVYFCGLAIFCVLRELIFVIRTDLFFLLGINFLQFPESTQCPALIIFSFLLSMRNRIHILILNNSLSLYTVLFLNERDKL